MAPSELVIVCRALHCSYPCILAWPLGCTGAGCNSWYRAVRLSCTIRKWTSGCYNSFLRCYAAGIRAGLVQLTLQAQHLIMRQASTGDGHSKRRFASHFICASVQDATNSGVEIVRRGVKGLVCPCALHHHSYMKRLGKGVHAL